MLACSRAGEHLRGRVPKLFKTFEEIISRAHGNFEESSTVIINYCITIINVYYNYIFSA